MPMSKPLTPRELEVLKLVAEGKENRQIAQLLQISARTVEGHRSRAMLKLNLKSLAELVMYAVRSNLIEV
jgi:DNA-binding NarL/FixJ family response regulator